MIIITVDSCWHDLDNSSTVIGVCMHWAKMESAYPKTNAPTTNPVKIYCLLTLRFDSFITHAAMHNIWLSSVRVIDITHCTPIGKVGSPLYV